MNILYLAHRIPYPPNKGDKLRAFRVIEHLAKKHRVWCACFVDRKEDKQHVAAMSAHCHKLAAIDLNRHTAALRAGWRWLLGGTITESYYRKKSMADTITRWATSVSFDAVIAFSSSMAQYIPLARAKRSVLDLCDLDSKKWLEYADSAGPAARVLFRREASRLSLLEVQWIERCDAGVLITEAEARALNGSTIREKIHVIGNGVDIPTPGVTGNDAIHRHTVGFVGQMDYRPNVDAVCWFVRNCWESIRRRWPEAVFQIVGRQPVQQVKRLANIPGVEVVGEVEHVAEYVEAFDVSVAPLRIARGLQNKVLEAMSALRPVVLTPAAAAGIDAVDGTHWLIADSATDMVEQVSRLLGDPAGRARIGTAAQAFVAQHHRWQDQLAKFDQLIQVHV